MMANCETIGKDLASAMFWLGQERNLTGPAICRHKIQQSMRTASRLADCLAIRH
jgi:hypothetical protein